jgi:ABC-type Fe3+ transport system permease subunit
MTLKNPFINQSIITIIFYFHTLVIKYYFVLEYQSASMEEKTRIKKKNSKRPALNFIIIIIILTLLIGIPYIFLNYQARKNGTSPGNVLKWMMSRTSSSDSLSTEKSAVIPAGEKIDFPILR